MRPWLVMMIDSNTITGLEWVDKVRSRFSVAAEWLVLVAEQRLVVRHSMQSKGSAIVGTHTSLCVLIYTIAVVQLDSCEGEVMWSERKAALLRRQVLILMGRPTLSSQLHFLMFCRKRPCSQFPGSMQPVMAGTWRKTHVFSRSGPSTQVSWAADKHMKTLKI